LLKTFADQAVIAIENAPFQRAPQGIPGAGLQEDLQAALRRRMLPDAARLLHPASPERRAESSAGRNQFLPQWVSGFVPIRANWRKQ